MPRLFIAIEIPDDIQSQLIALKTSIPTARWTPMAHMHLTLRFIGDVADAQLNTLKSQLTMIACPVFDLWVQGVGRFPPQAKRAPRVLWAGINSQPLLLQLQQAIEQAVVSMGFQAEDRAYHPHLTLARLKTDKAWRQVDDFVSRYAALRLEPFRVESFVLMKSDLTPQGPIYTQMARFDLV